MIAQKNLLREIADHLLEASAVGSRPLAEGSAIAVLSSVIGTSYCVPQYALDPRLDSGLAHQIVTQSVILLGEPGSGKGNIMSAVSNLLRAIHPAYPIYGFLTPSADTLWRQAAEEPFLWLAESCDHHLLAKFEPERGGKGSNVAKVLATLIKHKSWADRVERPFTSRKAGTPSSIRRAPPTILAETTPMALETHLPEGMQESSFFGRILMVPHDDEKIRARFCKEQTAVPLPSDELVARLRALHRTRSSTESVVVGLTDEAAKEYRRILHHCLCLGFAGEWDAMPMLKDQTLNVAALRAIGRDWEVPTINLQDIREAFLVAVIGREHARQGLEGAGGLSALAQDLLRSAG